MTPSKRTTTQQILDCHGSSSPTSGHHRPMKHPYTGLVRKRNNGLFGGLHIMPLVLFLCLPMMMTAQSVEPVSAGSGTIFGGPVVPYSTIQYHRQAIDLDSVERREIKGLERFIHGMRRQRPNRADRLLKLKFYNYTAQRSSDFSDEVDIQVSALERDFTADSTTYYHIFGDAHPGDWMICEYSTLYYWAISTGPRRKSGKIGTPLP